MRIVAWMFLFACGAGPTPSAEYEEPYETVASALQNVIGHPINKPVVVDFDHAEPSNVGRYLPDYNEIELIPGLRGQELWCSMLHELGHANGLHHLPGGVMDPDATCDGYTYERAVTEIASQIVVGQR